MILGEIQKTESWFFQGVNKTNKHSATKTERRYKYVKSESSNTAISI